MPETTPIRLSGFSEPPTTKPPLEVSERAARRLSEAAQPEFKNGFSLRLRVVASDGCCQSEKYAMALTDDPKADEVVVESRGVKVLLESGDAERLRGAIVDFVQGPSGSGFDIVSQGRTHVCGCSS